MNRFVKLPLNAKTPLAMSRVLTFGKVFDGTPNMSIFNLSYIHLSSLYRVSFTDLGRILDLSLRKHQFNRRNPPLTATGIVNSSGINGLIVMEGECRTHNNKKKRVEGRLRNDTLNVLMIVRKVMYEVKRPGLCVLAISNIRFLGFSLPPES